MHKATDAQATENATKRYKRSDNVIPDFEHLFDDDVPSPHKKRKKKSTGILYYKRLLSKNAGGVFLSLFMFILKNLPVWIIPIITSQIIDLASGGFGENTVRSLIIYSAILVVVLVQNIPTHVIYSRISDRMLRRTGATAPTKSSGRAPYFVLFFVLFSFITMSEPPAHERGGANHMTFTRVSVTLSPLTSSVLVKPSALPSCTLSARTSAAKSRFSSIRFARPSAVK